MTAIFTVLGLGLFSGGLYAVYSGWPYLVLERGFTQVIIGSIMATGGLILLALAWLLREIAALRRQLAETSYATTYAEPLQEQAPAVQDPPVAPAVAPAAGSASRGLAGAGAAAVAAGAAAVALSLRDAGDEAKDGAAAATEPTADLDRDLFGALVAERLSEEVIAGEAAADEPPAEAEPREAPDLFEAGETGAAETLDEAETLSDAADTAAAPVTDPATRAPDGGLTPSEPGQPAEAPVSAHFDAPAMPRFDEADPFAAMLQRSEPEPPADPVPQPLQAEAPPPPPPSVDEIDEFTALRQSLTQQLGGRVEPSLASDPFALPDDWLSPRREPPLTEIAQAPGLPEEPVTTPDDRPWPPRGEAFETPGPAADEDLPDAEEIALSLPPAPEPDPAAEAEALADTQAAASEEGIVGAYQVGDAHFTIFADGSIRARTPDGDYSFGSMDELKTYLASEKSRLGV